jgi:tRNA 2-thiouridine synthesizing protein C
MNSLLIISTHLPSDGRTAQDALEAALAASNVGLDITFVLEGKGCEQGNINNIGTSQDSSSGISFNKASSSIPTKSMLKQLRVLPLYDIEKLFFVKPQSSYEHGDTAYRLEMLEEFTQISEKQLITLCYQHATVLRF